MNNNSNCCCGGNNTPSQQNNVCGANIDMNVCDKNINMLPMLQTYNTIVLKPNICCKKNILTQQMLSCEDTKYVIRWDFDLNGQTITIPERCILEFDGGSLNNGVIEANNASLSYNPTYNIFNDCIVKNLNSPFADLRWFGAVSNAENDSSLFFRRALENYIQYNLGAYIYVVGTYTIGTEIETTIDLNIKGESYPSRILIENTNNRNVVVNPPSVIKVAPDITAFHLLGIGTETERGWTRATHMNFENLTLLGDSHTNVFVNCHTIGAPSRPGKCVNVEASLFDTVFYFGATEEDTTINTSYYNFTIGDNCNFFDNNYVVNASRERITLGGLCLQNSVIEQNEYAIKVPLAFGSNVFHNCLFEGTQNNIDFTIWRGALVIDSCYFEANSGTMNISGSAPGSPIQSSVDIKNCYAEGTTMKFNISYTDIIGLDQNFINNNLSIDGCDIYTDRGFGHLKAKQFVTTKRATRLPNMGIYDPSNFIAPNLYSYYFDKEDSEVYSHSVCYNNTIVETKPMQSIYQQLTVDSWELNLSTGDYIVASFYKTHGKVVLGLYGNSTLLEMQLTEGCEAEGMYILCVKINDPGTKKVYVQGRYTDNEVYISRISMYHILSNSADSVLLNDVARIMPNMKSPNAEIVQSGKSYSKIGSAKLIQHPITSNSPVIYYTDTRNDSVFSGNSTYKQATIETMAIDSEFSKLTNGNVQMSLSEGDYIVASFYKTAGKCVFGLYDSDTPLYNSSNEGYDREGYYAIAIKNTETIVRQISVFGRYTGDSPVNISRITLIKIPKEYACSSNYVYPCMQRCILSSGTTEQRPSGELSDLNISTLL